MALLYTSKPIECRPTLAESDAPMVTVPLFAPRLPWGENETLN